MRQIIQPGLEFELNMSAKTASLIRATNPNIQHLTVPETVNGCRVVQVAGGAFYEHNSLLTIQLPDSIGDVGDGCFMRCARLSTVKFYSPNIKNMNPLLLGHRVFYDCKNLKEFSLDNVKRIDMKNEVFYGCADLARFNGYLGMVGARIFSNCPIIDRVVFDENPKLQLNTFEDSQNIKIIRFVDGYSESTSKLKQLKDKIIRCHANSNLAFLAYQGFNVEII